MSHFHQANKLNYSGCKHCSEKFAELRYYNQGEPGTVNSPKIGEFVRSAFGGVGFNAPTKAWQNDGGYAKLYQAYPGFKNCNPSSWKCPGCN